MTPIAAALAAVSIGKPKNAGRLTVFPFLGSSDAPPAYLLLDEALAKGVAQVTETSTSGSVPKLKIENRSNQPILIVDGEALLGAKQNRIVNISILVPAQSITPVPVSCVERGRWSYRRPDFGSADHVLYSRSRARKAWDVSTSLKASGLARADQGAIWNDIAEKSERMGAVSRSEAMDALFAKAHQELENLELGLQPEKNQVGAAFALDGRLVGLEVFDNPETWRRFSRKVYHSYGLDALDTGARVQNGSDDIAQWLKVIAAAPVAQFPSVGLGQDVRFEHPRVSGGALVVDQTVIHCAAFDATAWQ
jgi:hypothetical protein